MKNLAMVRLMICRALALVVLVAPALPAGAAEAYQIATISSLLAGGYDGNTTVGEMLRHGSEPWQLWLFGLVTAPVGLWLWHQQGAHFGLGKAKGQVSRGVAIGCLVVFLVLLFLGLAVGGE